MYRRGAMSTEGQVQACVVKFKTAPKMAPRRQHLVQSVLGNTM